MRPRRLEMRGFAAFRDEQVISFDDLDLFAITGETGAGKSSILDAVTFALFGEVPRLHGARGSIGSAITLGQPRMTVQFDFEARGDHWRVTRSTPLNGPSKVAFERRDGQQFVSAGEGSDRVKLATQMIIDVIGLDFRAFTRSVLLPQGKFQEFLVGDASERRTILTELLGLELFGRLAKRAGASTAKAKTLAEAKRDLYDKEYAGTTPESIEVARLEAKEIRAEDSSLADVETKIVDLAEEARASVEAIKASEDRAVQLAKAAERLEVLVGESAALEEERRRLTEALGSALADSAAAVEAHTKATEEFEEAERQWGSATDLAALRGRAESLARDGSSIEADAAAVATSKLQLDAMATAASKASELLDQRAAALVAAAETLAQADQDLEGAQHRDLVGAVARGLKAGDVCPVCGDVLAKAPARGSASALSKAEKARASAAAARDKADAAQRKAEKVRDDAHRALDEGRARVAASKKSLAERRQALIKALEDLGELGDDAVRVLGERIQELSQRAQAVESARNIRDASNEAASSSQRRLERTGSALETLRAKLDAVEIDVLVNPADHPSSDGADAEVSARARSGLQRLQVAGEALEKARDRAAAVESGLLEKAHALAGGSIAQLPSVDAYVQAIAAARRDVAGRLARAESRVEEMERRAKAGEELQAEVVVLQQRATTLGALAKELRADRIVSFLQHEALIVLAVRASDHLMRMSGDAYRLTYEPERDEFWVIDMANGEEERPARTLSGGETFLASLSLALALSEGVQALAVEARPPLDSLFLDEGFGTLDQESLETVVQAIEHLGGDGRMVGVITHVRELALRLPARIEVHKGERGSRARVVAGSIEG